MRAGRRRLARRIAAWSSRHAEDIGAARPVSPTGLNDSRQTSGSRCWRSPTRPAAPWPERAAHRRRALRPADAEDIDSTLELQLLADIHETWPAHIDRRFSAEIVQALNMLDGRPWSDFGRGAGITTNWLAGKLKDFGIRPKQVRIGPETKQGYHVRVPSSALGALRRRR